MVLCNWIKFFVDLEKSLFSLFEYYNLIYIIDFNH